MELTKISTHKDVWELSVANTPGVDQLEGTVWHVKFHNQANGDKSARHMFADQKKCTVTADKGFTGTDKVTVSDGHGHEVVDEVTFT